MAVAQQHIVSFPRPSRLILTTSDVSIVARTVDITSTLHSQPDTAFPSSTRALLLPVSGGKPRVLHFGTRIYTHEDELFQDLRAAHFLGGNFVATTFLANANPYETQSVKPTFTILSSTNPSSPFNRYLRGWNPECSLKGDIIILRHNHEETNMFADTDHYFTQDFIRFLSTHFATRTLTVPDVTDDESESETDSSN